MGQRFGTRDALDQAATIARELKLPPERLDPLRDEAIACLALPDLKPSGPVIQVPPRGWAAFDFARGRYALRFRDGMISVRSFADDQEVARFTARGDRESGVFSFSPDGRYLATTDYPGGLTVWDVDRHAVAVGDPGPVSHGHSTRFSPDSRLLALAHDAGELLVYDLASGLEPASLVSGPGPANDLAFRGDGAQIALPYEDKTPTCRIRETETGRLVRPISLPTKGDWVAWSPDGQWLATGTHDRNGSAQVWRLRDATQVAHLAIEGWVVFSPDGKWLMTQSPTRRLWAVGTWHEVRQIDGAGLCISPDCRQVVVQDASKVIRLVEAETGRTLARLESPDLCTVAGATFSADGSRLVVTTGDGPAVHVWDLRAIRRQLATIGLDWDAPAYSDDDPASPALSPLPPLKVDCGPFALTGNLDPKVNEPLIADLENALSRHPDQGQIRSMLAQYCNSFAWELVTAPVSAGDSERALSLAHRAVELAPKAAIYLNTLGVAQYRAGQSTEAIATLEKSLAAGTGDTDAFDLFFLAMARFKLGEITRTRADFDRAAKWRRDHPNLPAQYATELDSFQAETKALLESPPPVLPADVFASKPSG